MVVELGQTRIVARNIPGSELDCAVLADRLTRYQCLNDPQYTAEYEARKLWRVVPGYLPGVNPIDVCGK
jgi:hypothetical protein